MFWRGKHVFSMNDRQQRVPEDLIKLWLGRAKETVKFRSQTESWGSEVQQTADSPDHLDGKLNLTRSYLRGGDESGTGDRAPTLIEDGRIVGG